MLVPNSIQSLSAKTYYVLARARSLNYFAEYSALRALGSGFKYLSKLSLDGSSTDSQLGSEDLIKAPPAREVFRILGREIGELFKNDSENMSEGIYPPSVLIPESVSEHLKRIPRIMIDGIRVIQRRKKNNTKEFNEEVLNRSANLPDYYKRNFHFQTDGYLSENSAELYEHQVELLFAGSADAMRRLILAPLKQNVVNSDGRNLKILEIGAGTGRASRFVRQTFPNAHITVSDMSSAYLNVARKKLSAFADIDFVQAAGEDLPFKDEQFDGVFSVFLFHELPIEIRRQVIAESRRVLKPGGFLGAVDSLQLGDLKEMDPLLENFPKEFHEPFYKNYIQIPLENLFSETKSNPVKTGRGFLSKVVWTRK